MFRSLFRSLSEESVTCRKKIAGWEFGCDWTGTIKECKAEWYSSSPSSWMALAGREGWKYKCPNCGNTIREEWLKMS